MIDHNDYTAVVERLTSANSSRIARRGFRVVTRCQLKDDNGYLYAEGMAYLNAKDKDVPELGENIAYGRAKAALTR